MIRWIGLAFVLLAAGCRGGSEAAPRATGSPPTFADYPVESQWRGNPAPPDLATSPDAARFGPALWQGARRGPNFAGHYTIVSRRCGRLCREFVIVDARTGRVHAGLADTPPFRFRIDSRLIAFEGPPPSGRASCPGCSAAYYVWNDPRLEMVSPATWIGSAPPPPALRPFVDSVRAEERSRLQDAGPAVTRPAWDRLVIAARDGSRTVLADQLDGDRIERMYVVRGTVASDGLLLVEMLLPEGHRYTVVDVVTGRATEVDVTPSPAGARD